MKEYLVKGFCLVSILIIVYSCGSDGVVDKKNYPTILKFYNVINNSEFEGNSIVGNVVGQSKMMLRMSKDDYILRLRYSILDNIVDNIHIKRS